MNTNRERNSPLNMRTPSNRRLNAESFSGQERFESLPLIFHLRLPFFCVCVFPNRPPWLPHPASLYSPQTDAISEHFLFGRHGSSLGADCTSSLLADKAPRHPSYEAARRQSHSTAPLERDKHVGHSWNTRVAWTKILIRFPMSGGESQSLDFHKSKKPLELKMVETCCFGANCNLCLLNSLEQGQNLWPLWSCYFQKCWL